MTLVEIRAKCRRLTQQVRAVVHELRHYGLEFAHTAAVVALRSTARGCEQHG